MRVILKGEPRAGGVRLLYGQGDAVGCVELHGEDSDVVLDVAWDRWSWSAILSLVRPSATSLRIDPIRFATRTQRSHHPY